MDRRKRSVQGAGSDPERVRDEGRGHDAGGARCAGPGRGPLPLCACVRRQLRGYDRGGRRLPRSLLLCCSARHADRRRTRIFQRHGGGELHRAGRAWRHSRHRRSPRPDGPSRTEIRSRVRGAVPTGGDGLMFPIRDTQPSYSTPMVTIALILVNALVFFYEISLDAWTRNDFIAAYGLVPEHFTAANLITSMFLHGGWMHMLGNMWFLWIFGDNIEDILGHGKFLLFYLACGVGAALTQYTATLYSDADPRIPMVGASGAIAGVMGAYLLKFPHSRIYSVVTVIFFF